ncbi:hypothetical protein C8R44DRAFT_857616 [Mycena epipterygia]|nr:hypothetical protein C8R44DRAFT_857616 [Mycena epipterygia]
MPFCHLRHYPLRPGKIYRGPDFDLRNRSTPSNQVHQHFFNRERGYGHIPFTRARCFIGLGQIADGLTAIVEATKQYQEVLWSPQYGSTFDTFPWLLRNILPALEALPHDIAALDATVGIVNLARTLAKYLPAKFNRDLKNALEFYAKRLVVLGQTDKAEKVTKEAAGISHDF